ncbi:MAG: AzlC family ABC transporter permease [Eubacterium sp.]|nr:AzlC family ABC transporter permease [Candidatus Colimonas fimequi]
MGKTIKYAFVRSIPIMAGYIVLGTGFGILLDAGGYGPIWALAMSVFIYAGSMQYVAVDLLTGGANLITVGLTTLMVNARHLFYSISMVESYKDLGKLKPYTIFGLTDEVYSIVCDVDDKGLPEGVEKNRYCFFLSAFCQSYWIIGSLIGSILGGAVTYDFAGIEFSMTALFVAAFVEQWGAVKNHIPAITGVGVTLICLIIWGPASFLIPAMIGITIVLTVCKRLGFIGDTLQDDKSGGEANV